MHRQTIDYDHRDADLLLVLSSGRVFDEIGFDEALQREIDQNLAPDFVLLLVRETDFADVVRHSTGARLTSLFARLPATSSVCVVAFNARGEETDRRPLAGLSRFDGKIETLKQRALTDIFRRREAMVEAGSTYHFRNPSGRHTDRFMRIANVMSDPAEISFFAFCALPFVDAGTRMAYVDTPALYPLVSAINDHYRSLQVAQHLEFDSFGSYAGLDSYQFSTVNDSVFLISASSSGSLAARIKEKAEFIDNKNIVNVAYLSETKAIGHVVCNLRKSSKNPSGFEPRLTDNKDGACSICSSGSVAIHLRGDRFEITGPEPKPVMVTVSDAPDGLAELMRRLVGTKALTVGIADRASLPKHFSVDFEKLLRSQEFGRNLARHVVRSFPQAATCIVAVDDDSVVFAEEILRLSGAPATRVAVRKRDELVREIDSGEHCHVVIAASVIESGRSLLEVSRDLRLAYPKAPQTYYIGFAKLESADKLKALKSTLTKTSGVTAHGFYAMEEMVLPPSVGDDAWARERTLLQRMETISAPKFTKAELDALKLRRNDLERTSRAIVDGIYLPTTAGSPLSLHYGFVFWPPEVTSSSDKTQGDIYYTISSVLQSLRSRRVDANVKSLRNDFFLHNVLDPAVFGRFNDGVIQASLLRAAQPHELDYTDSIAESREAARIVRRVLIGADGPAGTAAAEFLMALATGTLRLRAVDLAACLSGVSLSTPFHSALLKLLRHPTALHQLSRHPSSAP